MNGMKKIEAAERVNLLPQSFFYRIINRKVAGRVSSMKTLDGVLQPEVLAKLKKEARQNTHYNENGYATMKRGSEIDEDDVWEKDYEELIKAERRSAVATAETA